MAFEPSLVESLREQPSFLQERYNQLHPKQSVSVPVIKGGDINKGTPMEQKRPIRSGGVYIPPHRLRAMQEQILQTSNEETEQYQKMMWELLRKSINGIINKVNISNIQNIVIELFNENVIRGKGLLARAIIKAQMASPNFTHVYAALIAILNTKLPEIGDLIIRRVLIQFRRSFQRNNKVVCQATIKMLAHLINQRVLGEFLALQLLTLMLQNPTEDSVELACDLTIEVGQVLTELTPSGASAIFQRFKSILHESTVSQKVQYSIQKLFAIRKTNFKQHPGVIPELDLVEQEDQITHNKDLDEDQQGEESLNLFKFDPDYRRTEEEWEQMKLDIIGEENLLNLKQMGVYQEEVPEEPDNGAPPIQDLTEQDLINMRKTIYLTIQATVGAEECAHKLLKMGIARGYQSELVEMVLQCCMVSRIYQQFYGLLAERFCRLDTMYVELFVKAFIENYNNIFKLEANRIRNLGLIYGYLFGVKAIDWKVFEIIKLTNDTTTAAGRTFLKFIFRQLSELMGIETLYAEFQKEEMKTYYEGLFPMDHPANLRFAINFFTAIQLGRLTEDMREILRLQEEHIMTRRLKEEDEEAKMLRDEQEEMLRIAREEEKLLQGIDISQMQMERLPEKDLANFWKRPKRFEDEEIEQEEEQMAQMERKTLERRGNNRSRSHGKRQRSRSRDGHKRRHRRPSDYSSEEQRQGKARVRSPSETPERNRAQSPKKRQRNHRENRQSNSDEDQRRKAPLKVYQSNEKPYRQSSKAGQREEVLVVKERDSEKKNVSRKQQRDTNRKAGKDNNRIKVKDMKSRRSSSDSKEQSRSGKLKLAERERSRSVRRGKQQKKRAHDGGSSQEGKNNIVIKRSVPNQQERIRLRSPSKEKEIIKVQVSNKKETPKESTIRIHVAENKSKQADKKLQRTNLHSQGIPEQSKKQSQILLHKEQISKPEKLLEKDTKTIKAKKDVYEGSKKEHKSKKPVEKARKEKQRSFKKRKVQKEPKSKKQKQVSKGKSKKPVDQSDSSSSGVCDSSDESLSSQVSSSVSSNSKSSSQQGESSSGSSIGDSSSSSGSSSSSSSTPVVGKTAKKVKK